MALTFTNGPSRRTPQNPSETSDLPDPREQKKQIRQIEKQKKELDTKKKELEQAQKGVQQALKKTFKSAADALRVIAEGLREADVINYQEFIRTTGDIGIGERDIESIVTSGRDYEIVLTGDIKRILDANLSDAFKNNSFDRLRYEGGNWIMSFRG